MCGSQSLRVSHMSAGSACHVLDSEESHCAFCAISCEHRAKVYAIILSHGLIRNGAKPTSTASLSLIGNHFAQPRCVRTWMTLW
eukprot:2363516-Amphidinium_carterae.1